MTNQPQFRTEAVYIKPHLLARLRFLAEVNGLDSSEEQLEIVVGYYMEKEFPQIEAVFEKASRARKKVLEEAKAELIASTETTDQAKREAQAT